MSDMSTVNTYSNVEAASEPMIKFYRGTVTLRATITAYLIVASMLTLLNFCVYLFSAHFFAFFIGLILILPTLALTGVMFYAIQPNRLLTTWMSVFMYFYGLRALLDVSLTIWLVAVVVASKWFIEIGVIAVLVTGAEVFSIYFLIRHSLAYRAYAVKVHKKQAVDNLYARAAEGEISAEI
ncbi:hypothetical protein HDU99_003388 [Rhizoclosmatium hyalinum]|nr:hypothetical protein HDU99_003388 [Rhizoclosmatium hyalinum]